MSWLEDLPIKRKLTLVILLSCSAVLFLACVVLAGYELFDFRKALVRDMTVLADVLAKNTQAALAFEDEATARSTLLALRAEPFVSAAELFAADGRRFASYAPSGEAGLPDRPGPDGYRFEGRRLLLFRPVVLDDKRIGTIYLQAELTGVYDRLRLFGGIAVLVLLGSFLVAWLLSSRLQRPISEPILALADAARAVAEGKDYSVRATARGHDETALLTNAFNHMLSGIAERESALREEIAEREAAESRVQSQVARLELMNRITRAIGERQDPESVFQVVMGNLEERLPVDFGCVCLEAQPGTLALAAAGARSAALAKELVPAEQPSISVDLNGLSPCMREGKLIFEPDCSRVPYPMSERLSRAGLRSLVIAPLLLESQVFGVIVAARRAVGGFSSSECEFLKQLSEQVALAMNQKQLYGALQQAYDDLRQSQQAVMQHERLRALGQMASGIAHDINNAISPVMVYTDLLLTEEPDLSKRARGYLETMQRAVSDVAATVSRMREFYRQREKQLTLAPVPLDRLVHQVIDLSRARWNDMPLQRGIVIEMATELAPRLPPIMGVESEIREALVNLIFNAVDAMPDGGKLTVRTTGFAERDAELERVCIEVSDTGVGMDEDTRRRCLEPFFTTKGERGTGLGLAMVYGVVQRHSADIEIESEVGRGTTIRLVFTTPTKPLRPAPGAPAPVATLRERLRILVVDDDPLLLKSLCDALENDGHSVTLANGGQAGIEAFREAQKRGEPFSVVFTDLGMPYVDGRKVATAIKEASPRTPVVMLTGWGQRLVIEEDVPPNVDCLLNKPPKVRDLREALVQCLQPGPR